MKSRFTLNINPIQANIIKGIIPKITAVPNPRDPRNAKKYTFGIITVNITKNSVNIVQIIVKINNRLDLSFCVILNFTIPILG